MKYSQLVPFVTLLGLAFGPVQPDQAIDFSEDCCGEGKLSAGVSVFGLKVRRRDVPCLRFAYID